jgi:hypothetical protein
MSESERPYICECGFCGDGLIRFFRCSECDHVVGLCDECELMWEDIERLSHDPNLSADSSFPVCPSCGYPRAKWSRPTVEELEELDLDEFISGESS